MSGKNHKESCCVYLDMIRTHFWYQTMGAWVKTKIDIEDIHLFLSTRVQDIYKFELATAWRFKFWNPRVQFEWGYALWAFLDNLFYDWSAPQLLPRAFPATSTWPFSAGPPLSEGQEMCPADLCAPSLALHLNSTDQTELKKYVWNNEHSNWR